jgi:hypothetical protein
MLQTFVFFNQYYGFLFTTLGFSSNLKMYCKLDRNLITTIRFLVDYHLKFVQNGWLVREKVFNRLRESMAFLSTTKGSLGLFN